MEKEDNGRRFEGKISDGDLRGNFDDGNQSGGGRLCSRGTVLAAHRYCLTVVETLGFGEFNVQ